MSKNHGCSEEHLAHYTCYRTKDPVPVDGHLEAPPWSQVPRSDRFVDLVDGRPALLDTRIAMAWDESALYTAFWIEEPNIEAHFAERDDRIYLENDVEVFIAGLDCYYEFQINALGTIYEVFYIWQEAYKRGSRFDCPQFDLSSGDVDVLGGFQDSMRYGMHPRGARWAFRKWDFPGLQTAVYLDGSINDPSDIDRGWRVEIAFPWTGIRILHPNQEFPPHNGDTLRMDFSRFQKWIINGREVEPHPGWALNRHGIYDSHIPECFSYIHFSEQLVHERNGGL